jgi:hypothetical protein
LTYYVKNGDYIGRSAAFFALLIVLIHLTRSLIDLRVRRTAKGADKPTSSAS